MDTVALDALGIIGGNAVMDGGLEFGAEGPEENLDQLVKPPDIE